MLLLLVAAVASAKEYGRRELAGILRNAGMDGYKGVSLADCKLRRSTSNHVVHRVAKQNVSLLVYFCAHTMCRC